MSGPLKDKQLQVRLDGGFDQKLSKIADEIGQTPSGLARELLEAFVAAHEKWGIQLAWPPRFQHFEMPPVEEVLHPSHDKQAPFWDRSRPAEPRVPIAADPSPSRRVLTPHKAGSTSTSREG